MLLKIKVDLGARYLEVLVLPPEGTWILNQRDSSQPERFFSTREIVLNPRDCSQPERLFSTREIVLKQRDCFADCQGEAKILEQDQDGKGRATNYQEEHKKSMIQCTVA